MPPHPDTPKGSPADAPDFGALVGLTDQHEDDDDDYAAMEFFDRPSWIDFDDWASADSNPYWLGEAPGDEA